MSEKKDTPTTNEEVVEMHKKARKKKKRRMILTIVIVVAAVVIVLAVLVVVLRNRINENYGDEGDQVTSAVVTTGSITTAVSGSGTLSDEDVEDIDVPSSIEVTEFYVEEGDIVEEGDLIATVTRASLTGALSDTQNSIETLDEQLKEAAGETVSSTLTSSVSGRVKYIGVTDGEDVANAMYENGALMLLSLDGYMAVDIETDDLNANDSVTVTTSAGTAYDGTVESVAGGTATVLFTDDGPLYQDTVTVSTKSGKEIGSGELYIHSQMGITGYTGTVSSINVSENSTVSEGTTLLTLTDTETSASYDTILVERKDLEDQLDTLIHIYKDGGICAPCNGTIESIDESLTGTVPSESDTGQSSEEMDLLSGEYEISAEGSGSADDSTVTVASIAHDENMIVTISVDETDILSLSEGQEVEVTIDSIGDEVYEGTVTGISTTGSGSSGVTQYSAEITIPKTEDMLSGMSASVNIRIEGVEDALIIPEAALHQTSSTSYVYTRYDEDKEEFSGMKEVTAGLSNGTYVEITSGLSEGDVVYYTQSGDDEYLLYDEGFADIEDWSDDAMGGMPGDAGEMPGGTEGMAGRERDSGSGGPGDAGEMFDGGRD